MTKYAPANEAGEKPYIVWKGWSGVSELQYGDNLRHALERAYGIKGAPRPATVAAQPPKMWQNVGMSDRMGKNDAVTNGRDRRTTVYRSTR